MAAYWCFWQPSSFHRKDLASVAQPHDEQGTPVASYWLAWPPYIDAGVVKEALINSSPAFPPARRPETMATLQRPAIDHAKELL